MDDEGGHQERGDLLESLADPKLDPARDTLSLWDGERMIGYGKVSVWPSVRDVDRVSMEGRIHPDWRRRGLGRRLLDWECARALAAHHEHHPGVPGEYSSGGNVENVGEQALFAEAGFAPVRYYLSMERDLSAPIPEASELDGLLVVPFDVAWEEATRIAHNEAFLDHWGSLARDADDWRRTVSGSPAFRAPMSVLALDGNEVAAYVMAYEHAAATSATGVRDLYIRRVGTRRPYRGRGVARTLLAHVLAAAAGAGYDRASLGVDAENPTGALGLYERIGFVTRRKRAAYSRPM